VRQRTVSATIVFVATVVPLLLGTYGWLALVLLVLLLGARELARGFGRFVDASVASTSIVIAGAVPILAAILPLPHALFLATVTFTLLFPLAWHARTADFRSGLQRGTLAGFGAVYLGVPLAASLVLRRLEGQPEASWMIRLSSLTGEPHTALGLAWLAWALAVTWLTDMAAYLIGARFGQRKLAPRISPGKTWEGAVAGCLAGILIGSAASLLFGLPLPLWASALLGGIMAVLAELGDLIESYIKRALGIKDFGALLPGHGGMLDRIDALLVTLPATLLVATLLAGGH